MRHTYRVRERKKERVFVCERETIRQTQGKREKERKKEMRERDKNDCAWE